MYNNTFHRQIYIDMMCKQLRASYKEIENVQITKKKKELTSKE